MSLPITEILQHHIEIVNDDDWYFRKDYIHQKTVLCISKYLKTIIEQVRTLEIEHIANVLREKEEERARIVGILDEYKGVISNLENRTERDYLFANPNNPEYLKTYDKGMKDGIIMVIEAITRISKE